MELRDLIVTPILIVLLYIVAYIVRPWVTDEANRRYFFPALTVKIFGALALGFIYQFYYDGGDTYNYHTHGSRHIWEAFWDSPEKGTKLFFNDGTDTQGIYKYSSRILFFGDPGSYTITRIAFILDLFTFSSYSGTAVLFALLSFAGAWMFFLVFYEQYPSLHREFAIASFFIPSVFFWGSGLLKDTITLTCLNIAVYQTYRIFIVNRFFIHHILMLLIAIYGLYEIKIYILLTFLPTVIFWIGIFKFNRIRSIALKVLIFPLVILLASFLGFQAIVKASEENSKYSIDQLAKTAQVTAYDIRYWTGRDAGSGYSLGELDGTFLSLLRLSPQAINVSLFRPYLWEVRNPLMLLSSLESLVFLISVVYLFFKNYKYLLKAISQANVIFLMMFSMAFSFAVGVSTFNFGTLVRYKIPMLPFFAVGLILVHYYSKSFRKESTFEEIE